MPAVVPNIETLVDVVEADRDQLRRGLLSTGAWSVAMATSNVANLPDSDGALQMLARHRLAQEGWTRTNAFNEAAAECLRAAKASTFADTVSEDERKGYQSACNLMAMSFRVMASRAAPWQA